jgi:hypothetical protein
MKDQYLEIVCDGSGDATVNGPTNVCGILYAIEYLPGSIATGATVTVTSQGFMARTLLVKASAGTSNTTFYPRDLSNKTSDGSALTDQQTLPLISGVLRVVVASGGNGGKGSVRIYYWTD